MALSRNEDVLELKGRVGSDSLTMRTSSLEVMSRCVNFMSRKCLKLNEFMNLRFGSLKLINIPL